jgi:hypothetical protein
MRPPKRPDLSKAGQAFARSNRRYERARTYAPVMGPSGEASEETSNLHPPNKAPSYPPLPGSESPPETDPRSDASAEVDSPIPHYS